MTVAGPAPLDRYLPLCRAMTMVFPNSVEVVLHDLGTGRIAHIEGAVSPRKVGDLSLVETADYRAELRPDDTIGPYLKSNPDGARLRSVSALLRDDSGNPVALLCINLRIDALEAARRVLAAICAPEADAPALLRNDWRELANTIVANALRELKLPLAQLRRQERRMIVERLLAAGIFSSRGAADYVAQALGISRASLYVLIRTANRGQET